MYQFKRISMKRNLSIAVLALLAALLAACSSDAAPAQVPSGTAVSVVVTSAPAAATNAPNAAAAAKPEAGKATVIGRVLSKQTGAPITATSVRLAEVTRQGSEAIYVLDGAHSPGALTGGDGRFVMANIVAREYVLVI